jgi:hypothetical protein
MPLGKQKKIMSGGKLLYTPYYLYYQSKRHV